MLASFLLGIAIPQEVTLDDFRKKAENAKPGDTIYLAPGTYPGGLFLGDLKGTKEKPIIIGGSEPSRPPVLSGGNSGIQISRASHLIVQNLIIEGPKHNGLNVDDGGDYQKSSMGITIRNVQVRNLPAGNHDGVKLSGISQFLVENCSIEKWGGSGIDMVGCHDGVIRSSRFQNGGDSAVQAKGGSANIKIEACHFRDYGQRGVNIGGSTGREFFRPPLSSLKEGERFESKRVTVTRCTFSGGTTPVAFVGADEASVVQNTIYHPERWALRILQETRTPDFLRCRNGVFQKNLIMYRSSAWASGGVNVGDLTEPETFQFNDNFWYCSDQPDHRDVRLPGKPKGNVFGQNPLLEAPEKGDFRLKPGSPAVGFGVNSGA